MRRVPIAAVVLAVAASVGGRAQPVFTGAEIFPAEEFAARRAKIFETIGDGVAAVQGTTERPGEQPLRQNNQFFYLTGVVEPRALLWLDGRTRQATVYLQPNDERRRRQIERMYGDGLVTPRRGRPNSTRCGPGRSSPPPSPRRVGSGGPSTPRSVPKCSAARRRA